LDCFQHRVVDFLFDDPSLLAAAVAVAVGAAHRVAWDFLLVLDFQTN